MTNIKAGDLIKSYDFAKELQPGCYMVGLVTDITDGVITAKLVKAFFDGKEYDHVAKEFKTVSQGMGFFDDRDTRIELIASKEDLELVVEAA